MHYPAAYTKSILTHPEYTLLSVKPSKLFFSIPLPAEMLLVSSFALSLALTCPTQTKILNIIVPNL